MHSLTQHAHLPQTVCGFLGLMRVGCFFRCYVCVCVCVMPSCPCRGLLLIISLELDEDC